MNYDATGWLLVVEDNLDIWAILKLLLPRALPKVQIVHAPDAPTALALLETHTSQTQTLPRLILQNLYLPERATGLGLLSQLKQADSPYHELPIVVMSSSTDQTDVDEVHRLGARFFLTKPAAVDQWMKALQGLYQYGWNEHSS